MAVPDFAAQFLTVPDFLPRFRIKGREKWYESVEEMQVDLDDYLVRYNTKRPHQGRDMKGRTPYTVFMKGLPKKGKKTVAKKAADAA